MKKHAFENQSIFPSTYVCGQFFPNMNNIKNRYRTCPNCLKNDNLQSWVKTTGHSPHVQMVWTEMQEQKSH